MVFEQRRAVVEAVRVRLTEVVAAMSATVRAAIPAYQQLQDDQRRDVAAISSWAVLCVLEAWAQDRSLTDQDLARFHSIGSARAEDGRPLRAVLRSYRIAAVVMTDKVLELGHDRLEIQDVQALTRVLLTVSDEISEAMTSGHIAATQRLAGDRGRARRELLDDLLIGRMSSAGVVADRGRELGLTLPQRLLLVVARPVDGKALADSDALKSFLGDLTLSDEDPGLLATLRGRHAVLLLPERVAGAVESTVCSYAWQGLCAGPAASHPGRGRLRAGGAGPGHRP
ncbi:hypothetical protein [Fodinicola feengrottensis]|uniref:hypothetical protein n=1 Tax=Fodinicola feengrottensis TaxID=435914 RepID=UPI0013D37262|nr:hypothetical protein [Fodinicola feengrottensis]